jgi:hypothetical protein
MMDVMKYLEITALKKNTKTGIACTRKGIYVDLFKTNKPMVVYLK